MEQKQWQYGMNIYAGLLLFFLPWLLRFENVIPIRSWDFFVVGVAVIGFGALALHKRARLAEWGSLIARRVDVLLALGARLCRKRRGTQRCADDRGPGVLRFTLGEPRARAQPPRFERQRRRSHLM